MGNNTPQENQRLLYLDVLRILATLAVIVLHISSIQFKCGNICPSWYYNMVVDCCVRWCVPIFVMISGTLHLNPNKEVTYRGILLKSVPRLLIAFIFWTLFYFFVFDYEGPSSAKNLLHPSSYHLWFLPMLAGVYLLIPIMRKITEDNVLMRYTIVLWMAFFVFCFISSFLPFAIPHIQPLLEINPITGYAGYFILGYYLSQKHINKRNKLLIFLIGTIGLSITIILTMAFSVPEGRPTERFFNYLFPNIIAMAIAIFVLIKETHFHSKKCFVKTLEFVRKDLFGIYLTHLFWLNILHPLVYGIEYNGFLKLLILPIFSIIVFVASLITTKLIRVIPILKKVVE